MEIDKSSTDLVTNEITAEAIEEQKQAPEIAGESCGAEKGRGGQGAEDEPAAKGGKISRIR